MKSWLRFLSVLTLCSMFLAACGTTGAFTDLPDPVKGSYQASYNVLKMGDTTKGVFSSYFLNNNFNETHDGAGGMESDDFVITVAGVDYRVTRSNIVFGDVTGGEVTINKAYRIQKWNPEDPRYSEAERRQIIDMMATPVVGYVTLQFESGGQARSNKSLNILTGCPSCAIDKSKLTLVYTSDTPGVMPTLTEVQYSEAVGVKSDFLLMGGAAWFNPREYFGPIDTDNDGVAETDLTNFGFWQFASSTELVRSAFEVVRTELDTTSPDFRVEDLDSASELIGRQTGLRIFENGVQVGRYDFTYKNNYGHMPNTPYIGKGALSRVERYYKDSCYAITVKNPAFATSFSTLYVFSDCSLADKIENTSWGDMYEILGSNTGTEGLYFGVYSNGYVGTVTDSITVSSVLSGFAQGNISLDQLGSFAQYSLAASTQTVKIGEGGGVYYAILGYPTLEQLKTAHGVIGSMTRGPMDQTGFGYASSAMSGNGLAYYLGAVILSKCAGRGQLGEIYGCDSGLLDRAGFIIRP